MITSSVADVRDIVVEDGVAWVATSGGLAAYDAGGKMLAVARDLPSRDVKRVWPGPLVETAAGTFRWDEGWVAAEAPRVAVPLDLPGPPVDVAMVDGELRIACVVAAVIVGETRRELPIPATAAGAVWGTMDGALVDDAGRRVGAVPGAVTAVAAVPGGWIVGTHAGTFRVTEDTRRLDSLWPDGDALCGNFVTGLARQDGTLVVGTFDGGACRQTPSGWEVVPTPSPMVNDVAVVNGSLRIATAEGLVVDGVVYGEALDGKGAGLNHDGANAISGDWVVDVLGPVRVSDWHRYRWHVSGHSYQVIAACPTGEIWAGSEDDGLAVSGVRFGRRNGRSSWRHVGMADGLPEDWVMAVACAGKGAAWVGTYRNGVGRVDAKGWHPVAGLEDAWVQALATQGDTLWVGTADGLYAVENGVAREVAEEDVWTLLVEGDRVWAGTRTGIVEVR